MGLIKAFNGALSGTFQDQWIDIITAGTFDEHSCVLPGIQKKSDRSSNTKATDGIITNGSKILVPENTAAFIFDQGGIEEMITDAGGYEYQNGEKSVMSGSSLSDGLFHSVKERFKYGGQSAMEKKIAFINLREIRGIKFGTNGPQVYHDHFYGADLEIRAFGTFSIKIVDPTVFIRNFVPTRVYYYSFDDPQAREQILPNFFSHLQLP